MNATTTHDDDDMPAEVDFTGATRGKFYRPNLRLNLPLSQLANDLLKRESGIIEAVK